MESLDPRAIVRQSERTASRVLEERAVVIVLDAQRVHALNEVGTRVWELAGVEGRSIEAIAHELVEDFEVTPEVALADTLRFVSELQALGALEVASP